MSSRMGSWLRIPSSSQFSLANIPFGIISTTNDSKKRPAIAIGDFALDLADFAENGGFSTNSVIQKELNVFSTLSLNSFAALGRAFHRETRQHILKIFAEDTPFPELLRDNQALRQRCLIELSQVKTHLPLDIGDYTDFFAGKNHAFNVGVLFRGRDNALQPNYTHLPVAYHGRASSVVVSGTALRRPWGQIIENPNADVKVPIFTPCRRLDIELELGMFVCKDSALGEPINVNNAKEHIFGYVLMNDWSARDIQVWEYVPLGPFNAKNFGTTISPWVVLADALEPFATKGIPNETPLQSYLKQDEVENVLDINLEVDLTTKSGNTTTISRTNAKNLLWSWSQMLAHHSVSGCSMRTGDLLGSGTISGTEPQTQGSLLEQIDGGKTTIKLNGDEERKFLQDGDSITIRGWSGEDGALIGFGQCSGTILPALNLHEQ